MTQADESGPVTLGPAGGNDVPPKVLTLAVRVILQRLPPMHPWLPAEWHAVDVLPQPAGASESEGTEAAAAPACAGDAEEDAEEDEASAPDLLATPPIVMELHAKEAEGAAVSLQMDVPRLWVIIDQETPGVGGLPVDVQRVTVSAYEAQEYLDAGDLTVDALPMPASVRDAVAAFVAAQPAPEPFRKRRNRKADVEEYRFGKEPLAVLRQRMQGKVPR